MLTKGAELKVQNSDILFFLGMGEISLVVEKSWAKMTTHLVPMQNGKKILKVWRYC